jgi:hypothetical protein
MGKVQMTDLGETSMTRAFRKVLSRVAPLVFLSALAIAPAHAADNEKLIQVLAAEPNSATACLEMRDTVQTRAEERITELGMDEQTVQKVGEILSTVEAQCQGALYKDAWTSAVALKQMIDPAPQP